MRVAHLGFTAVMLGCLAAGRAEAATVFMADFGAADNLNPADLVAALNAPGVTQVGTWSHFDESDAPLTTDGLVANAAGTDAGLVLDYNPPGSTRVVSNQSIRANLVEPVSFAASTATIALDWVRVRSGAGSRKVSRAEVFDPFDNYVFGLKWDGNGDVSYSSDGATFTTLTSNGSFDQPITPGSYDPGALRPVSILLNPSGSDPAQVTVDFNGTAFPIAGAEPAPTTIGYVRLSVGNDTGVHENHGAVFDNLTADGTPTPAAEVLAGWYDFGPGNNHYETSPKAADVTLPGVSATIIGGDGQRGAWSSTDGLFGDSTFSTLPGDTAPGGTANGAFALRTLSGDPNVDLTITNNSPFDLALQGLLFDYTPQSRADSPDTLSLVYLSGDLDVPGGTSIATQSGLASASGPGSFDDYLDFRWGFSGLADRVLGAGESATFRFTVSNAGSSGVAGGLDNLAFVGFQVVPEPSSIALAAFGLLTLLLVRLPRNRR
jgi:hypothetical protein